MITIIGASGSIGSNLVKALEGKGYQIFSPNRSDDLSGKNLGTLIYCAGYTGDWMTQPLKMIEAHVILLTQILKSSEFKKIIYLSSTRLYDTLSNLEVSEWNNIVVNPNTFRNMYDISKLMGESICLHQSPNSVVARLSCVYDNNIGASGFLSSLIQRAKREKRFSVQASQSTQRDYIYMEDVVTSIISIVETDAARGIINVASGQNLSNQELIDIFNRNGWDIKLNSTMGNLHTIQDGIPKCNIDKLLGLGNLPRLVEEIISKLRENCEINRAN